MGTWQGEHHPACNGRPRLVAKLFSGGLYFVNFLIYVCSTFVWCGEGGRADPAVHGQGVAGVAAPGTEGCAVVHAGKARRLQQPFSCPACISAAFS